MVVYNFPPSSVKEKLQAHLSQLSKIYVIDNSDIRADSLQINNICREFEDCVYIGLNGNRGIAEALNIGCNAANNDGYSWVLTLDQDSTLPDAMLINYLTYINQLGNEDLKKIGMLTCRMSTWIEPYRKLIEDVNLCWTSGSLMNLQVFKEVDGFESKLFIDGVDFDICAKIILKGYRIIRMNNIVLDHQLGNTKVIKLFGRKVCYVTNHAPIRRYYMTRNNLYLNDKYGDKIKELKINSLSKIVKFTKIILFEKDKIRKIRAIREGAGDYRKQKFGKKANL